MLTRENIDRIEKVNKERQDFSAQTQVSIFTFSGIFKTQPKTHASADEVKKTPKLYYFNNKKYFVDIEERLEKEEKKMLERILSSFPHATKDDDDWVEGFLQLDIHDIPPKIIEMAANAYDSKGNRILGLACALGNLATVERLIRMGANPNKFDYKDQVPLHYAINRLLAKPKSKHAVEIIECLLDNSADPNLTCFGSKSPLERAIEKRCKIAENIIEKHLKQTFSFKKK